MRDDLSETDPVKFLFDRITSDGCVPYIKIRIPTKSNGPLWTNIAAWADHATPAALSNRVSTMPPLTNDDSPSALGLIRSRIDDCLKNHKDCKVRLSGNIINESCEPELPKRVIEIGTDTTPSRLRLLTASGLRGHYAALSHCWGHGRHPIRTTNANLEDHLNNIAFETLPKTFQDAVVVTHGVGLRFLWIDSLCIVQDDRKDWLEQSEVMGLLYESAYLTIAASAARNSTEGCFRSIRPAQQIVKVPFYNSPAHTMLDSFYVSTMSPYSGSPEFGPLSQRAWVLQERRLSRRKVHFTVGGLSWECKTHSIDERGVKEIFDQNPGWDHLLERYSECELTVETDRLIALQGLVNEMQKKTLDRYHAGSWEADLPGQLLWMIVKKPDIHESELLSAPSWSWASQLGSKLFWSTIYPSPIHENVAHPTMMTENMDIIKLEAPLRKCMISKQCMINQPQIRWLDQIPASPEGRMISFRQEPIYYIQGVGRQARQLVGLAALDSEPFSGIHCLFLASHARRSFDPLSRHRKDTKTTRSFRARVRGQKGMDLDELNESEVTIGQIVEYHNGGPDFHLVLLVQPLPQGSCRFKRVGMGIVWSKYWAPRGNSRVSIELV